MTVSRHPNNQGVSLSQWRYTATGGETTLSGTDGFATALAYTVGAEQLFVNGVLLERGVDYVATTGTTVTGLTALVAGDIVTVSSPSSFSVANAIPLSTITAKGDHLVGTGASTVTNLPVGADGTTLVADSSTSTGLRYNPTTGNQNFLINGGQDIWQRGTSFTGTGWAFTSDRWAFLSIGGNSTVTQETSVVPVGFKYSAKFTANATVTGYLSQSIETLNTLQLAGKTVAFSAQVAASTSIPLQLVVEYSTTVDATSGGSWTGITATSGSTATPTSTTFIPISGIFAIPSNAQTIRAYVRTVNTITSGQTFYFGASKLEIGNVPTAYTKAGGTIQGELAACSRYFQVLNPNDPTRIIGQCISSTRAFVFYGFFVTMRGNATPTFGAASNYQIADATANGLTCTGATFFTVGTKYVLLDFTVASGLVAGNATQAILTGASSTISLSAEL